MHLLHVAGGHEESQAVTNTCKRANGDVLGIACQMLSLPVWFFDRGSAILLVLWDRSSACWTYIMQLIGFCSSAILSCSLAPPPC